MRLRERASERARGPFSRLWINSSLCFGGKKAVEAPLGAVPAATGDRVRPVSTGTPVPVPVLSLSLSVRHALTQSCSACRYSVEREASSDGRTDGPHAWDLQHRSPAGIPRTRWNPSYEYFSSGANCMIVAMSTPPSLMLASAGQVVIRTEKITVLQCLTLVISFTERPDGCTGDWMDDELPTQE